MQDNRPKFPYDFVVRNKQNGKVECARIIDAANAGEAISIGCKHFGIELTRGEYTITARRIN